jgi:hypothetical protein
MKRSEWWMAACIVLLALGINIARAQDSYTRGQQNPPAPELLPIPKCYTQAVGLPPCSHDQGCCTDAVGCKACSKATHAAQTKCEGCEACCKQAKKPKKVKHAPTVERVLLTPPPAPPMMPVPSPVPVTVYVPNAAALANAPWCTPMPAPPVPLAAPMMVFRAAAHSSQAACGSACDHGVEHAKYEISGGSYAFNFDFGFPIPSETKKHEANTAKLEIECGGLCKASCEKMTLHLGEHQDVTIATTGKQVSITGPSFKATCDNLTRCGAEGCLCLLLQGHVHMHHDKGTVKSSMECDELRILLEDGHMEISIVSAP